MANARITKRVVDALGERSTDYVYWDPELKGFGVRVRPSGRKSFVAVYRTGGRNSQLRKVTIGTYGRLTAEEAREEARKILAKAELGHDVAGEKAKARAGKTVAELCDLYFAEGCDLKKPSTLASDRGRIERHIKPLLGNKLVAEVTGADVEKFMRDVAIGKTAVDVKTKKHGRAIVRGGRGTATRTVRLLGGIFSFAIRLGMRVDNPTKGVEKYKDGTCERFLSTAELERLGEAIREAETTGIKWDVDLKAVGAKHLPKNVEERRTGIGPHAAAALRLLILTGCRLREILHLQWQHVDMERGLLFLPDSKTGAKSVTLSALALDVLASIPRIENFPYVIAGEKIDKPRSDLKRPWALVTRRAGLNGLRVHDLRHTYASFGAAGGVGLTVVGKLLGHADVKTTSRYSHLDADPLRRAANAIGNSLSAALGEHGKVPNSAQSPKR
jgi:integrase